MILFRMSKAGSCPKALAAELLGFPGKPEPEWLADAAEEGKVHEQLVKDRLRKHGYEIIDEQQEVCFHSHSKQFIVKGHIDGKIYNKSQDNSLTTSLLEVKSMSQFEFDRWIREGFDGFPTYQAQMNLYLQGTGLQQCVYAVKNRSTGYIDTRTFTRGNDHYHNIIAIELRLQQVVDALESKELPAATYDSSSFECRRCRFSEMCIEPVVYTEQEQQALKDAVIEFRIGKEKETEGKLMQDNARTVFENHLHATSQKKLVFDGIAAQLIDKKTESYDKKILKDIFKADDLLPALKKKEWTELRVEDLTRG